MLIKMETAANGDNKFTLEEYTTNITFSDTSTYHLIGRGYFVGGDISRGNVTTAPKVQIFLKKNSSSDYVAISNEISTVNGTTTIPTYGQAWTLGEGDIYIKRTSGSAFTSTSINLYYVHY